MAYPAPHPPDIAGVISFTSPGNTITTNQASGYVEADVNTSIVSSNNLDISTDATSIKINVVPEAMNTSYMTNLLFDTSSNLLGTVEYNPLWVGAVSTSPLDITPADKGRIVILTGNGITQPFSHTTLTNADAGCWILVRNGNPHTGPNAHDITISGISSGDTTIHVGSNTFNAQSLYVVWDGSNLNSH